MSAPGRLRHRVGEAIAERALWGAGDRLLVAVSGGLDSMCLLDLLGQTARWHEGRIEVVTVDHGTRPGSPADAAWVVEQAVARGHPAHLLLLDLPESASEAQLRAGRYAAMRGLVRTDEPTVIVTAHHRDDQVETVLLMLLRGTGLRGLAGMAWRRADVARPLLSTTRAELEAWAAHRDLPWREDPTNREPRFLRNRLRGELVPLLEELRPGATAAIARVADRLGPDAALLDDLAHAAGPSVEGRRLPRAALLDLPDALAVRVIARWLPPGCTLVHAEAVCRAMRRGSGRVALPAGNRVLVNLGDVFIETLSQARPRSP